MVFFLFQLTSIVFPYDMTGHAKFSAGELESLRRHYRALEAPPFLASRIRAVIDARTTRSPGRRPLLAGVAIAICVLAVLPFIFQQEAAQQPVPQSMVSLSMTGNSTYQALM